MAAGRGSLGTCFNAASEPEGLGSGGPQALQFWGLLGDADTAGKKFTDVPNLGNIVVTPTTQRDRH